jgi:toxin FitB
VIRYLIDTNVISELRKKRPHGGVIAWMESLRPEQILLSAVTIGEIQSGVELTRKQDTVKAREIENWLDEVEAAFAIVSMSGTCFREWSRLMTAHPIGDREDTMIAATARVHGLTIATRNERDFENLDVDITNPFRFR